MAIRSVGAPLTILVLAGCAGRQAPPAGERRTEVRTTTATVRVDSAMPASTARAVARADSATRANAARLAQVEVRPDTLTLRVGARHPLTSVAITFRDSAGGAITGIVPHFGVSLPVARITDAFELEALAPGRAELRVRPMTRQGAPRPDVPAGVVRITVVP